MHSHLNLPISTLSLSSLYKKKNHFLFKKRKKKKKLGFDRKLHNRVVEFPHRFGHFALCYPSIPKIHLLPKTRRFLERENRCLQDSPRERENKNVGIIKQVF
jgi:hypothetical protein